MVIHMQEDKTLLKVNEIKKYFVLKRQSLLGSKGLVKAVDGVSFCVSSQSTLSLVGESGCGKTTIAKLITLVEELTEGHILYKNRDLHQLKGKDLKQFRSKVQSVMQDPASSLSPRMRVGRIIAEPMLANCGLSKREVYEQVDEVLEIVGLSHDVAKRYPHEFSGGQKQRIAIARALLLSPEIIVLDEPLSGQDVSIQGQLLRMLVELQEQIKASYLFISHNLATVKYLGGSVAVMYLGKIIEHASASELFKNPLHPYTRALFSASLPFRPDAKRDEIILDGEVPSPMAIPSGCRFHPRCYEALPVCFEQEEPPLKEVAPGHLVACFRY